MIRNYFADLDLDASANEEQVRQAYRKLARRFHPDLNPDDPRAAASFRRIHEAYEKLNSSSKIQKVRSELYRETGGRPKSSAAARSWSDFPVTAFAPEPSIHFWKQEKTKTRTSKTRTKSKIKKSRVEELDVHVVAKCKGVSGWQTLAFEYDQPCPRCRGAGSPSRSVNQTCKSCAGLGYQTIERGAMAWKKSCETCLGKGYQVLAPCTHCEGRGKMKYRQTVRVVVPNAPVMLKFKEMGHVSFDGKKRGDLWLEWQ